MTPNPDYIVVGAGSAGCVVARVLVERGFRVALIEAGSDHPVCRIPALYPQRFGSDDDWGFETVAQPNLGNRKIRWPRGRGPGGSTRINAMIWFPPLPADLESLAIAGGHHWSTDRLLKCLQQVTDWVRPEVPNWISESTKKFLRASGPLGLNAQAFARMTRQGQRFTAADLLSDSLHVDSVQRITGNVQRVVFHQRRAAGVELVSDSSDDMESIHANIGVILCAGAVASPIVMMRSGIGPEQTLHENRIDAVHVAEQVGLNLSDHLLMPIIFATPPENRYPSTVNMHDLARFQIAATGPLSSNLAEAGCLLASPVPITSQRRLGSARLQPAIQHSLAQLHVTATHYLLHPHDQAPAAMTLAVNLCNPKSRGRIRLAPASANPATIEIDPGYLSEPSDLEAMIPLIDVVREIAMQLPLASLVQEELIPGSKRDNRESLVRCIARFAQTLYHPTGTCRMGFDRNSVVDERLAVRGVTGLHVIDASVLPSIPSVNPNAMVMMTAMQAAMLISAP